MTVVYQLYGYFNLPSNILRVTLQQQTHQQTNKIILMNMDKSTSPLSMSTSSPTSNSCTLNRSSVHDHDNSSSYENDDFVVTKGPWTAEVKIFISEV